MANVIKTVLTYPLDGSTRDFNIPFEYLARKFVVVTLIGVDRKVLTINTDYRFATRTTISLTKAWGTADGYTTIELRRVTSTTDRLVDFTDGSILRAYDLNVAQIQTMHVAEEARDLTADTIGVNNDGHLDARGRRIVNLANAVDDRDAVPFGQLKTMNQNAWDAQNKAKQYRDEAEQFKNTSKEQAGISTTKRNESEGFRNEALQFRNEAEQFKTQAGNSQTAARNSEVNAKTSETNAKTSEGNALTHANRAKSEADRAKTEADRLGNLNALALDGGAQYIGNSAITVRDMEVLKSSTWVNVGQFYDLQSYVSLENGGRGYWLAVDTTTVTPNGIDIVQSIAKPEVSFAIQPVNGTVDIRQLGAIGGADVTHILNRAYKIPNVNTIYLSAIVTGEVFKCSNKIVAGKTTIGINKPVFDFNYCAEGVDAWSYDTGNSPSTPNIVYSGFEIRNAKFRGFSGSGDNVIFDKLTIRDASEQAIGWQGNRWKVIGCQIFGTKVSYDIVISGVSNDVEITGCHIEGAVTMGGIEPAYSCRNVNIHHNFIRNQPYGVLVWVRTPNGTDKLSTNISINNNIFSEVSKGGVWVRCDETDFIARVININDNLFSSNNADSAFAIRVGGWNGVLISGNTITGYNKAGSVGIVLDDFNGHPTGSVTINGNTFETIQQCIVFTTSIDGVVIKGNVARNVTYDFIVYPLGNTMANCKVSDNDVVVRRDYLRNFSYMSARHVRNNSFKLPLASVSQLNGAAVLAGDKFLLHPPVPGSAEGFVCTTGGVVGTNAVFKNLPTLP